MPSQHPQHRKWCFTINNPTPEDDPNEWIPKDDVKYACFQLERGSAEETPHWQGYLVLKGRGKRLTGMKKLNVRAHWEIIQGTLEQNEKYCSKEEGRVEGPYRIGEMPAEGRGKRNDLLDVKRRLDQGATDDDIADEFFGQWCRYERAFKRYRQLKLTRREWQTKVTVVWGPSGSGKTTLVEKLAKDAALALGTSQPFTLMKSMKHASGIWWDGYVGQEIVIIEEFEGWISRNEFKNLVNTTDHRVQTKGGSSRFRAREIFITSNQPPNLWWKLQKPEERSAWPQFVRRLTNPIGIVYKGVRNPAVAESAVFSDGFCIIEEDNESLVLPPVQEFNFGPENH